MNILRRFTAPRIASLTALVLSAAIACSGNYGTGTSSRNVAAVSVSVPTAEIEVGQSITAVADALDQYGAPFNAGPATWASTFTPVATVDPTTGEVHAIAGGMTEITASINGTIGRRTVTVSPPAILINELKPTDVGGGFVELFNPTGSAIDISGWTLTNSDVTHSFTIPAGASLASGGYRVINGANIPGGLGANNAVHLFNKFGAQSDTFSWTVDVATSYGRCPDGVGPLVINTGISRGGTNACS